jgi:hypothetical protein
MHLIAGASCQLTPSQIPIKSDNMHGSDHRTSAEWIKDHTQLP